MSVLSCPVCQGTMKESSRNGVMIDTCTQCRGVWLDRGELEKIASAIDEQSRRAFLAAYWDGADRNHPRGDGDDNGNRRHRYNTWPERRRSVLDFFE